MFIIDFGVEGSNKDEDSDVVDSLGEKGSNKTMIPHKKVKHLLKKQYVINKDDKQVSTWACSKKKFMNKLGPTLVIQNKHK
jgi:hypothetical protein